MIHIQEEKMELNRETNILIVGLGVIGGGYAKALTAKGFHVRCITKEQKDIDYALAHGMIREGSTEVEPEAVGTADLIVLALYPHTVLEWLTSYQQYFKPGAIVTDVTGVKSEIVSRVQDLLRPDVEFIAAHPMAGRERSGVEYSDDKVFCGANYIVTPTPKNTPQAVTLCKRLGEVLGFTNIAELTPRKHDEMIAFLSQLTHCIAVVLMNCNTTPNLEAYTGDSFRDLTRIAKINDEMWSELFLWNREELLRQMDAFSQTFAEFRALLAQGDRDGMREMMRYSSFRRTLFDKPKSDT